MLFPKKSQISESQARRWGVLVLQLWNFIEVCAKHLHSLNVVVPAKTASISTVVVWAVFLAVVHTASLVLCQQQMLQAKLWQKTDYSQPACIPLDSTEMSCHPRGKTEWPSFKAELWEVSCCKHAQLGTVRTYRFSHRPVSTTTWSSCTKDVFPTL